MCARCWAAWTAVLRYDYEPVFRPVLDVLEALAAADAQGGVNQAVRAVAAWAKENAEVYPHASSGHPPRARARVHEYGAPRRSGHLARD